MSEETEPVECQEIEPLQLKVKMSKIAGKGIARINSEYLPCVKFEKGELVEITNEKNKKAILVKILADNLIGKDMISLRKDDVNKLKIKEGDNVQLLVYQTMGELIKEKAQAVKEKLPFGKKKDEELDEEEEESAE